MNAPSLWSLTMEVAAESALGHSTQTPPSDAVKS